MPMFITHRKDLKKDGIESDDAVRLRRVRHRDAADLSQRRAGLARARRRLGDREHARRQRIRRSRGTTPGCSSRSSTSTTTSSPRLSTSVKEKYASPQTLGIMGGSNGGLLVGAVMEQRPDLFAVALPAVGVMDMLRYHKFSGGSAWATGIRLVGKRKGLRLPREVLAAAQHQGRHLLSGRRWSPPPTTTIASCRATPSSSRRRCSRRRAATSRS